MVSPSSLATRLRFLSEILPVWSSSNRLNTFWMSSRVSLSLWVGRGAIEGEREREEASVENNQNIIVIVFITGRSAYHLSSHHVQELIKVYGSAAIFVDICNHLVDGLILSFETQRLHRSLQLFRIDRPCIDKIISINIVEVLTWLTEFKVR